MPCSLGFTILILFSFFFTGVKEFVQGPTLYLNEEVAQNNKLIMNKQLRKF